MGRAWSTTLLVLAGLLGGCSEGPSRAGGRRGAVTIDEIQVGRRVGPDKRILEPAGDFAPRDTVYVSVVTEGTAPEALLLARWSLGPRVLEETEQRIAPRGQTVSEFHVRNPAGWSAGDYRVEIVLDGASAGVRDFKVREGA